MEYQSQQPDVWCLFKYCTDGYTFSYRDLLGVFLTQDDATTTLLGILENDSDRKFEDYEIKPVLLNELIDDVEDW